METKEKNIKDAFLSICNELNNEIENNFSTTPYGCCYLIGHCLTEGLYRIGLNAIETTGSLTMKSKKNKFDIVYGNSNCNGINVGYYHTWCKVIIDGKSYILDPSLKYNKLALKEYFNLKCNDLIPDVLVSDSKFLNTLRYIAVESLKQQSKNCLNDINPIIINHLINAVTAKARSLFNI